MYTWYVKLLDDSLVIDVGLECVRVVWAIQSITNKAYTHNTLLCSLKVGNTVRRLHSKCIWYAHLQQYLKYCCEMGKSYTDGLRTYEKADIRDGKVQSVQIKDHFTIEPTLQRV